MFSQERLSEKWCPPGREKQPGLPCRYGNGVHRLHWPDAPNHWKTWRNSSGKMYMWSPENIMNGWSIWTLSLIHISTVDEVGSGTVQCQYNQFSAILYLLQVIRFFFFGRMSSTASCDAAQQQQQDNWDGRIDNGWFMSGERKQMCIRDRDGTGRKAFNMPWHNAVRWLYPCLEDILA